MFVVFLFDFRGGTYPVTWLHLERACMKNLREYFFPRLPAPPEKLTRIKNGKDFDRNLIKSVQAARSNVIAARYAVENSSIRVKM